MRNIMKEHVEKTSEFHIKNRPTTLLFREAVRPEIVVIGSLHMDLTVKTEKIPRIGETVLGRQFTMSPGGKGANQAVAAAKLGADVTLVGRVGAPSPTQGM